MKNKGIVKRILAASAFALVVSGVAVVSAATKQVDVEPVQCQTICYYIMGVPIYCYVSCF